ncbi:hypothetical protein FB45DRAFT_831063 [Roridomyces roridus]|uniref:Transmembrane protein n=1 Tax=Roridomyces roridus TaxID=1738132 RepID=A0AAD7C0P4_9AGAR|nr:hypothetical protein FB45DRAFT_831063 [Roridomyces roridus]
MPFSLPSLEYPVTRKYPGTLFGPIAFSAALVLLVFLTVVNVALAGYDTVPGFSSDFNVTQHHWYDKFLPEVAKTKPGTLCDPRLLGLGDTITTNNTLFRYTVASIDKANAGDSGFQYGGWTLDNCDITSLFVNANAQTFAMDFTAVVACQSTPAQIAQGNDYAITLRADWTESTLPGQYGQLLGVAKAENRRKANGVAPTSPSDPEAPGTVLDAVTSVSAADFAEYTFFMLALPNSTFPNLFSFEADFPWCPAFLGPDAPCASQVPALNVTSIFEFMPSTVAGAQFVANEPIDPDTGNLPLINNDTFGMISNVVQVAYATIRLDIGNRTPKTNFLLNTSLIDSVIVKSFPKHTAAMPNESFLYSTLISDGYYPNFVPSEQFFVKGLLPLEMPGPALLDGVYLCRFQRAKSPGAGFIAVLVATLSMFTAAWGRFLAVSEGVVKRRPDGVVFSLFEFTCLTHFFV